MCYYPPDHVTVSETPTLTISCAICLVLLMSSMWPLSLTTEYKVTPLQKLQTRTNKLKAVTLEGLQLAPGWQDKKDGGNDGVRQQAAPGNYSEVGRSHAGAHKQYDVLVSGLSVVHHLLLEEFQVVLVVAINL